MLFVYVTTKLFLFYIDWQTISIDYIIPRIKNHESHRYIISWAFSNLVAYEFITTYILKETN